MSEDDSNTGRTLVIVAVVAVVALFVLAVVAVIGAAVIGAFVLDVGTTTSGTATSAGFTYTHSGDEVVVAYEGGSIDPNRIELYVNGELRGTWTDLESTHRDDRTIRFDDLRSGDRIEIREWSDDGTEVLDSYTV